MQRFQRFRINWLDWLGAGLLAIVICFPLTGCALFTGQEKDEGPSTTREFLRQPRVPR